METAGPAPVTAVLLHLLFASITLPLVTWLPGYLLLDRRLPGKTAALERWVLYATVGFWSVAWATSMLLLLPARWLGLDGDGLAPLFVVVGAAAVAAAGWFARRHRPAAARPGVTWGEWATLAVAGVVFLLFFVGIDDHAHTPWCLYDPLDHLLQGPAEGAVSPLLDIETRERLGNISANLIPYSLYRMAGVRVASGLFAALMFLAVAALARRITGRAWAGIAAGAALMFTDDVLGSQVVNVNMIAAWLAAALLLALHPRFSTLGAPRTFLAAALFTSRYLALLAMGAWLYSLWRDRPDGTSRPDLLRRAATHGALFALFTLPVHLYHAHELGTPFAFAAMTEYGAHPHVFLGWSFDLHTMLNVPFYGELVRTPFNPFPMWIGWPVHAAAQWGVLGTALALLGAAVLAARARRDKTLWTWLLFTCPVLLFLLVQENWIQPEKLTIGLLLSPVVATAVATALVWSADGIRPRRLAITGLIVAGVLGLSATGGVLLRNASFPEDSRFRDEYPTVRGETPAFAEFVRERWLEPRWTPLCGDAGIFHALGRKLVATREVVARPRFSQRRISSWSWLLGEFDPTLVTEPRRLDLTYANELRQAALPANAPAAATRALELSLVQSPMVAASPLATAEQPPDPSVPVVDIADGSRCATTPEQGLRLAFMDRPARVAVCRAAPDLAYLAVAPPPPPPSAETVAECRAEDEGDERDRAFCQALVRARALGTPDPASFERLHPTSGVRLVLPEEIRRIVLVEIVHLVPMRIYVRDVSLAEGPGAPEHGEPREWRHN